MPLIEHTYAFLGVVAKIWIYWPQLKAECKKLKTCFYFLQVLKFIYHFIATVLFCAFDPQVLRKFCALWPSLQNGWLMSKGKKLASQVSER